jgi:hypothetical protein
LAKVLIYNPRATPPSESTALQTMVPLRESRAGVFPNVKQHAGLLMNSMVDALGARYGVIKAMTGSRPSSSRADPALIEQFAASCDWVVTGSAD